MQPLKPVALATLGGAGASAFAGSLLAAIGSRGPGPKLENPFVNFSLDLECTHKKIFTDLQSPEQIKRTIQSGQNTSTFNLHAPTPVDGKVEACYKVVFHQTPEWQIVGTTTEFAASRGNHGIILLHAVANMKDYGGKINVFRAIFLEKGPKWQIKAGVQWTDEALIKSSEGNWSLKWQDQVYAKDTPKDIIWSEDKTNKYSFDDLTNNKNSPVTFSWKSDDAKSSNIFQDLTIKPASEVGPKTQDFWNGKPEPLDANSTITWPTALLDVNSKTWKRTIKKIDLNTLKTWFNLFKDDKGSWQKISAQ